MKLDAIKNNIEEILQHYPKEVQSLLKHQIVTMIELIGEEKESYQNKEEVKRVLDLLLSEVIQGKFLL